MGATSAILGVLASMVSGCLPTQTESADYVATLPALAMILEPLVQGRRTVTSLLPPGASPHTFTLRPSSARQLAEARAVFYADDALDGWAVRGDLGGQAVRMLDAVPPSNRLDFPDGHNHGAHAGAGDHETNGHFWSSPRTVAAALPALVAELIALDPEGREVYEANAREFAETLDRLDREVAEKVQALPPAAVVAFHPSWSYFFERYQINVVAYVEPIPGKEPTPQTITALKSKLQDEPRVIVLSEIQLARKSADALAEALGARVGVLDPLGGQPGMDSYAALIRYNMAQLAEVIQ